MRQLSHYLEYVSTYIRGQASSFYAALSSSKYVKIALGEQLA